jgi:hypothetical protein
VDRWFGNTPEGAGGRTGVSRGTVGDVDAGVLEVVGQAGDGRGTAEDDAGGGSEGGRLGGRLLEAGPLVRGGVVGRRRGIGHPESGLVGELVGLALAGDTRTEVVHGLEGRRGPLRGRDTLLRIVYLLYVMALPPAIC